MIVGIGLDLLDVARMERELRAGNGLEGQLFTPREIEYCEAKRHPARHFAARFAAKEALFKALAIDAREGLRWREVEVVSGASGDPAIRLYGKTNELAAQRGVDAIHLTLTHTRELAAANVVLQGRGANVTGIQDE